MAFTYFFRDAQTLELLIEQALPEHTQKMPESLSARFETVASYAQIHRRLGEPDCVHKHVDGPHARASRVRREQLTLRNG